MRDLLVAVTLILGALSFILLIILPCLCRQLGQVEGRLAEMKERENVVPIGGAQR